MIQDRATRPAALLPAGQDSGTVLIEGLGGTDTLGMTLEKASGAAVPTEPVLAAVPVA